MAHFNGAAMLSLFLTIIVALSPATIAQNAPPLVNFQVSQPLALPKSAHKCEVPLIHRVFGNSYYDPEIVQYMPPTNCGPVGTWAGISLNWTATSQGRQYDRLAGVTLGNVEIWRTSTSEPTLNGIIWTALKDVTKYRPLFSEPSTLIVDLNNILDPSSGLNGEYDVRLTATFYQSDPTHPPASTADLIVPLSTKSNSQSNVFIAPPAGNTTVTLPKNAVSAIVEVQASGNYEEEFWYYNLPDEYLPYVPADTTYGKSSFREVRVLVDGQLAGVVFPYPVLFTGAFIPTVWRPIVAYGAYDAPTYNVDLTPFIPLLTDGGEHVISLDVASDEPDHSLNPNWYLSGNIQVNDFHSSQGSTNILGARWGLNPSGNQTTGRITRYEAPEYASSAHTLRSESNNSYELGVRATRFLIIEADITPGGSKTNHVSWRQYLQFNNVQTYANNASQMIVSQLSQGISQSAYNSVPALSDSFAYPLSINFSLVEDISGSGYSARFDHRYDRQYLPSPWESYTTITSAQQANGTYITEPNTGYNRTANGTNTNEFTYVDDKRNSYSRLVDVTNNTITKDKEGGTLTWDWPLTSSSGDASSDGQFNDLPSPEPARIPARLPGSG